MTGELARPAVAVQVRCGTDWHTVRQEFGRLLIIDHLDDEVQRERGVRAGGGPIRGCFAVDHAWTTPGGWLPKELRRQRQDLWTRMRHGGTPTVVALLDAGMDPHMCDGQGRTLLHLLGICDHTVLLPRLLAAGLDVNAGDKEKRTPLSWAMTEGWPPAAIIALVDAGANPHLRRMDGMSVIDQLTSERATRSRIAMNPALQEAADYVLKHA